MGVRLDTFSTNTWQERRRAPCARASSNRPGHQRPPS
jgi:hypothetical protein